MRLRRLGTFGFAGALVMASGMTLGGGAATAHDDAPHPAHIHIGDCAAPGEVVIPLGDISHDYLVDGEASAGDAVGRETAIPTQGSVTTADVALTAIIEGGHVLMVHESADEMGTYVACGDVGGTMMGANDLVIGIKALNDSGLSGVAMLHDNGDESTTISVYLTESEEDGDDAAGGDDASPEADDASEDEDEGSEDEEATAGTTEISIEGFKFGADPTVPVEISVGTTVTWTNLDAAPHTVTSEGGPFVSGTMAQGATYSYTFEEAGTFPYFCEFHPMKGTIIVS